ncbi:MAG: HAMP domain-containing sensor histidine kinase [Bacteroidales bacterium]
MFGRKKGRKTDCADQRIDPMFLLLFRYSPVAMELYDCNGRLLKVNAAYKKLWNVGVESLEGHYNIMEDEKIRNTVLFDCVRRAYDEGVTVSAKHDFILPLVTSLAQPKILKTRVCPVKDDGGRISFVFLIHEDVGEILGIRDELIRVKREAENADLIRDTFLKNISHELKTPLNWIAGISDMLQDDPSGEMISELTRAIRESVHSLLGVIDKLIDISMLEADEIVMEYTTFRISDLLEGLRSEYHDKERKGELELEFVLRDELSPESDTIFSDRVRLRQVLINLIDNALGNTSQGYVEVGCRLTAQQRILFYVKDKGQVYQGLEPSAMFSKFDDQGPVKRSGYSRSGLGLSISKGLIEKLSGVIWVDGRSGDGETIFFELPTKVMVHTHLPGSSF